jgi:hypothetical protein
VVVWVVFVLALVHRDNRGTSHRSVIPVAPATIHTRAELRPTAMQLAVVCLSIKATRVKKTSTAYPAFVGRQTLPMTKVCVATSCAIRRVAAATLLALLVIVRQRQVCCYRCRCCYCRQTILTHTRVAGRPCGTTTLACNTTLSGFDTATNTQCQRYEGVARGQCDAGGGCVAPTTSFCATDPTITEAPVLSACASSACAGTCENLKPIQEATQASM